MDNVSGAKPSTWVGTTSKLPAKNDSIIIVPNKEQKLESFQKTNYYSINTLIDNMEKFYLEHPDKNTYDLLMNLRLSKSTIIKIEKELQDE